MELKTFQMAVNYDSGLEADMISDNGGLEVGGRLLGFIFL